MTSKLRKVARILAENCQKIFVIVVDQNSARIWKINFLRDVEGFKRMHNSCRLRCGMNLWLTEQSTDKRRYIILSNHQQEYIDCDLEERGGKGLEKN